MEVTLNLADMRKLDISVSEAVVLALAWDKKNQNSSLQTREQEINFTILLFN